MLQDTRKKVGPLVTVLMPTFNRPQYLSEALRSVLRQSYQNLQIIVVNDGGEDVSDIINSYSDPRLILINRRENRGKAFSLNQALAQAEGKYVAYLDDDDIYYPHHIETLVNALEEQSDYGVAYSDLYKTYCRTLPDGTRQVLSKVVEISRDFDRFFMLHFNHVLHVCLMHRRDLIEKTGPYNEQLNVLIDWDMTRRLAFFSDFYHVHEITGEFYSPIGECDRMSVQRRKNESEYVRNILAIRTARPAKPWPKLEDMSIIFVTDRLDKQVGETIGSIWRHTFYPYKLYLPLPQADFARLNTDMPNIVLVPVDPLSSQAQQIDAALAACDGEYITVVPSGLPIEEMWLENSLYALINSPVGHEGFELTRAKPWTGSNPPSAGSTNNLWAVVVRKDVLEQARRSFANLSIRQSLEASGVLIRRVRYEELPFQFDNLLQEAQWHQKNGSWEQAAEVFEHIAECHKNELWMKTLAANAFFKAGNHTKAAKLSREVNRQRPTVDSLLLEAKVDREKKNFNAAIELLKSAEQILAGKMDYPVNIGQTYSQDKQAVQDT